MPAADDRKEEIWSLDKDARVEMFVASAQEFRAGLDADTAVADDFLRHFAELFRILVSQQNLGEKGLLRWITISFLKSSVTAGTYEIATACHTADLYLDEAETETYWRMGFMKDAIERDMAVIIPNLKKKIFRIRDYEIEEFRAQYAYTYTALLLVLFNRVLPRVFDLPEFMSVQKEDRVEITFGGYMEETLTLIRYEKEGA